MPSAHPDKPPKGSPQHRAWVLEQLTKYARLVAPLHPMSRPFKVHERVQGRAASRPQVTTGDLYSAGGFAALRAEVLRNEAERASSTDVDFSGLDFEDVGDTVPSVAQGVGGVPQVTSSRAKPQARDASPREVLAERKATEARKAAERKVKSLARELEEAEARGEILDALGHVGPITPIRPRESESGKREAAAFVACSDWHVEEMVDPATVEGRNAYSPAIAMRRIERLITGTLWLVNMHRERFEIRDLILWLGGDLLSGYIHEELEETNAMTPPETVVWLQGVISGMIQTLLDAGDFERIIIPCNAGNHGRTTKKKRAKTAVKNSYEYIIYCYLADRFRDEPRVEFDIAQGGHVYMDVHSTRLRLHHGDSVRYWGGVGGLSIPLNKAVAAWQKFKPADLTVIGHFHQHLHGRDWVVNGSLVGYSEFALQIKAAFEEPAQAFFLIDKHRGRTCSSPIWVEERDVDWMAEWGKLK